MIDRRTFLTGSLTLGASATGLPLTRAFAASRAPTSLRQKVEQA